VKELGPFHTIWLVLGISLSLFEVHGQETEPSGKTDRVIAEVLGRKIKMSEKAEMKSIVSGALLERYAQEHKLEPTAEELEACVSESRLSVDELLEEARKERNDLLESLNSKNLTPLKRSELVSQLKEYDADIAQVEEHPEELEKDVADLARSVILPFKLNQALFRQYGGRVIFQQMGPEPLDAYRKFFEEQQKAGAFKILDESLVPSFWRYYKTDKMHNFLSKTREDGEKIFSIRWWSLDEKEIRKADKGLEELRKKPRKGTFVPGREKGTFYWVRDTTPAPDTTDDSPP